MDKEKDTGSSRRDRNRESVKKYRKKVKTENEEMEKLFTSNEDRIAQLEKMVDDLSAELKELKDKSGKEAGCSSKKKEPKQKKD